jgi:hypothetical protein
MIKSNKDKKEELDPVTKKIIKMYENYGMDVSNMSEEEFERIKSLYKTMKKDIDKDLRDSEKYKGSFGDDIM